MKELQIIIAGGTNTGKTTMMLLLEDLLSENGFNVNIDFTEEIHDFGGIDELRKLYVNNRGKRHDFLTNEVEITLKQINTTKNPLDAE